MLALRVRALRLRFACLIIDCGIDNTQHTPHKRVASLFDFVHIYISCLSAVCFFISAAWRWWCSWRPSSVDDDDEMERFERYRKKNTQLIWNGKWTCVTETQASTLFLLFFVRAAVAALFCAKKKSMTNRDWNLLRDECRLLLVC